MGIVKKLTPRRVMAFIASIIMMGSSLPGLAENNEAEITSGISTIEPFVKDPNDASPVEEQIKNANAEETQEEEELKELKEYTTEEYLENGANTRKELLKLSRSVGLTDMDMNDMLNTANFMHSINLQRELRENEDIKWVFLITEDYVDSLNNSSSVFLSLCDAAVKNPNEAKKLLDVLYEEEEREESMDEFLKFEDLQVKLSRSKITSIEEVKDVLNDLASNIPDLSNTPMEYLIKVSHLPFYYLMTKVLWTRVERYVYDHKNMDNATYLEWKKTLNEISDLTAQLSNFMREVIRVYVKGEEVSLGSK